VDVWGGKDSGEPIGRIEQGYDLYSGSGRRPEGILPGNWVVLHLHTLSGDIPYCLTPSIDQPQIWLMVHVWWFSVGFAPHGTSLVMCWI
jgi:hypothetical protein